MANPDGQASDAEWGLGADRVGLPRDLATVGTPDNDGGMPGSVETAIRASVDVGAELATPTARAIFVVGSVEVDGIVLLFGPTRTATKIPWDCLEGVRSYLGDTEWMEVGANRAPQGKPGTLDEYLKGCVKRPTANYVVVLLERAGVVELDRAMPVRVRPRS